MTASREIASEFAGAAADLENTGPTMRQVSDYEFLDVHELIVT
jgi:hypothetical protein